MVNLGPQGEQDACEFLQKHKRYRFLERNFRTPWGELDLVMEAPDKTIVIVEVKSRGSDEHGSPFDQIDDQKLKHLQRAISLYVSKKHLQERTIRLDAVGIEYADDYTIKHIEHIEDLTGW